MFVLCVVGGGLSKCYHVFHMKNTMKSCLKLRLSTVWVESERTGHYRPVGMATTLLRYGSEQNTHGMQHSIAMLEQWGKHSKQCRNNILTLWFAKNRRCKSSRVTSSWNRRARNFNLRRKNKITPSVFNKLSNYFWIVFFFYEVSPLLFLSPASFFSLTRTPK